MRCSIVWLRQDLRLADNPALYHAIQNSQRVVLVYIHAPDEAEPWQPGAASNWWRHHSLTALQAEIERLGGRLIIRRGASLTTLLQLCTELEAEAVYWNYSFTPHLKQRDNQVRQALLDQGIQQNGYNGSLLYTPGSILNQERRPYRVFGAFWKACQKLGLGETPLPAPNRLAPCDLASLAVAQLELLPQHHWHTKLHDHWQPGEQAAHQALARLCETLICDYSTQRDIPASDGTSRLSPHLAFGEISPRQIVTALLDAFISCANNGGGYDNFIRQLGWREFAYHCLHHFPHATDRPFDARFEQFAWQQDERLLKAWQAGETGIPIIDAGMHQLWASGWMHNRVRMITASLLTKNGLIPWQTGARWFWDTLVDADLALNSFNWQWVAGCGLDAAPYFRIFNPLSQSAKFDPDGHYIRRWLPQLAALDNKWLHRPWQAPQEQLAQHGLLLGRDYPMPVIEPDQSRRAALAAFQALKPPR